MYAIRWLMSTPGHQREPAITLEVMARFHVENFGCRTSQADGDAIAAGLQAIGTLSQAEKADVIVVNTCTVTAEADRDARAYIRRVRRDNPSSRIVVTGCYAQRAPEEVAGLEGVTAVVGNSHKDHVAAVAMGLMSGTADTVPLTGIAPQTPAPVKPFLLSGDIFAHSDFLLPSAPAWTALHPTGGNAARTRPSLKIQDGCSNRCTFCIIPSIRGNSRSMARAQVLREVAAFVDAGGTELVLTGINLGRWGRDLDPPHRLEDLIDEIFTTTSLSRLRISSVEPMDWTDGLIALFARWSSGPYPRLARHAHMPLQSGSDAVLRRMHRRYRPWHYAERAAQVRAASPMAAIGADVMVGFPGETAAEFQESYDFIATQPFTYLHLFPFSARPGTRAWELHRKFPVPGTAVRERMAALRTLIDRKNAAFRAQWIGEKLSAVTLVPPQAAPNAIALSDNFIPLELDRHCPANQLVTAQITAVTSNGLSGCMVAQL